MAKNTKIIIKGALIAVYDDKQGMDFYIIDDTFEDEYEPIGDLFDGKKFLEMATSKYVINYDGYISNVFIDKYYSNIGLMTNDLFSNRFLLNQETWGKLCSEHEVVVEWVNR